MFLGRAVLAAIAVLALVVVAGASRPACVEDYSKPPTAVQAAAYIGACVEHREDDSCFSACKSFHAAQEMPQCSASGEAKPVCRKMCERFAHDCGADIDCSEYPLVDCTNGPLGPQSDSLRDAVQEKLDYPGNGTVICLGSCSVPIPCPFLGALGCCVEIQTEQFDCSSLDCCFDELDQFNPMNSCSPMFDSSCPLVCKSDGGAHIPCQSFSSGYDACYGVRLDFETDWIECHNMMGNDANADAFAFDLF